MIKSDLFLKSALTNESKYNDISFVKEWIRDQNNKVNVNIEKIEFEQLEGWGFSENRYNLKHHSNKFFSIDGINVKTNWGFVSEWQQPIINQPEIGYLGFITKEFDGILHFLLQAKIEPGNVNYVQLSPTLQATKSNYTQVHKGKTPDYLSFFVHAKPEQILLDQLQSEQGGRFLKKRNRNIIIKIDEDIKLLDNFIWMTLGQIKILMQEDNLINMDTRTVISGITFFENNSQKFNDNPFLNTSISVDKPLFAFDDLIKYITNRKCNYELFVNPISLKDLNNWRIEADVIRHAENKYFKVIATKVSIENREVMSWTQPMIEPSQEGICAFVCKNINGIIHFIVQTKLECGNFDIIELAPTVQCLTGNFRTEGSVSYLPFLKYVSESKKENIVFDTLQSEEGGRFFKEQNRNMIVMADDSISIKLPENYIWMSLQQLQTFNKFNNYLNIQARSLIAAISYI